MAIEKIQIRHESASDGVKTYITNQLAELEERFDIISVECIVDQEGPSGHVKKFEAIVHVTNETITVHEKSEEIHKSIDMTMRTLEKLLVKHKETYSHPGAKIRHNSEKAALE